MEMLFVAALRATAALFSLISTYSRSPFQLLDLLLRQHQSKRAVKSGEEGKKGRRNEKVERAESRSWLPAARGGSEEGQCSDPYSHSISSTNKAGGPATEPGHLLLGTVSVPVHPATVSV